MCHSKHTKQNHYLLNLFSSWIFCRFPKFSKNVEPAFTILWNCLHERCFTLHTNFRLETGSTRKVSLSFWFVAASRKKSFHISIKKHNVGVKLCNLDQFLKYINDTASCKIFFPTIMFHHFTVNCIWSMPSLHELEQVLILIKQFSASSIETLLSGRY